MMVRTRLLAAAAGLALAVPAASHAQTSYPQTLYWGAGLVDIPVAWVAPLTGDFGLNYSGKTFSVDPDATKINYSESLNSQLTFSMSFMGRAEIGYAAYSGNPEWGFFGQAVLIRQEDMAMRGGMASLLVPSIAVGVRNIGPYKAIDRFGTGYFLEPPTGSSPDSRHIEDAAHRNFDTGNTIFGVVTKDFSLAEIRPNWPDLTFGVSVGYGNGLFSDDGGLGERYASHDRGGLFWGVKTDFRPAPNFDMSLMFEDNSWDYNLGASLNYRGIRLGAYVTELGAGSQKEAPGSVTTTQDSVDYITSYRFGYQKFAFTLGWQSNLFALLRGDFLQSRAALLERQRQGLLAEINRRQQRIAELELEINRYEAQGLLDLEQRRLQVESELRSERERLQRLEEQLKRIEQTLPPTTTPPATPPASNPPRR